MSQQHPRTIGEVAALAHVTVRTLHHYDELGLVSPSGRSGAGYRLYDDRDLERLQTVLFYRQLGFSLEQIRALMTAPDFDRGRALREQRALLAAEGDRLRAMIAAIDTAIAAHEGGFSMTERDMFEVFGDFKPGDYDDEVRERWGHTDAYKQSAARTRQYGKDEWLQIKAEAAAINAAFIDAMTRGIPATGAPALAIAEQHRQHITCWFYNCTPAIHRGLGEMFLADPRFTASWDDQAPGLAAYVSAAFLANADAHDL